jgi:N-acetylglucosamine-6-sulfatase
VKISGPAVAALLAAIAFATAGVVAPVSEAAAPASRNVAPQPRPNVVLILTDDMRADELRYLPNVRRLLVAKGVKFTNAISPHPMCCPARASLFTGQYGQNNGVRHNTGPWGGDRPLTRRNENIGTWLRRAGYRTSFHGKFLNNYEHHPWLPAGWTRWDAQVRGIYAYWNARFFNGDRYTGRYISRVMSERVGRTLDDFHRSGAPFFTWINHVAPHGTVAEPRMPLFEPKYARTYSDMVSPSLSDPAFNEQRIGDLPPAYHHRKVSRDRIIRLSRARARVLRSTDEAVSATVHRLQATEELSNTYIIFASDNGHGLGEHRLDGKNLLVDQALDVPLVIRGPGIPSGRTVREPVSLLDLPATILDWTNAQSQRRVDGLSLVPLLTGNGPLQRDTILVQTGDAVADATPGWSFRGVTTWRYLYGHRAGDPSTGILFDRKEDPHGLVNRFAAPAYAQVRRVLKGRTVELAVCSGVQSCNRVFGRVPDPG